MQPHAVTPHRFEDGEGADHVGVQERRRALQCIVDVALRGEMHHGVGFGDQPRHQLCIGDVADHQLDGVLDAGQRLAPARVSQGVEHRHGVLGVLANGAVHEIGADETRAAGDQ